MFLIIGHSVNPTDEEDSSTPHSSQDMNLDSPTQHQQLQVDTELDRAATTAVDAEFGGGDTTKCAELGNVATPLILQEEEIHKENHRVRTQAYET